MPSTPPTITPEYLTADEVAGLLKIKRKGVYALVRRPAHPLPVHRLGRLFRFIREEIHCWLTGAPDTSSRVLVAPLAERRTQSPVPPPPASFDRPRVTRASFRPRPPVE